MDCRPVSTVALALPFDAPDMDDPDEEDDDFDDEDGEDGDFDDEDGEEEEGGWQVRTASGPSSVGR